MDFVPDHVRVLCLYLHETGREVVAREAASWLRQTLVTLRKNPANLELMEEDIVDLIISESSSRLKAMLNHRFKQPKDVD